MAAVVGDLTEFFEVNKRVRQECCFAWMKRTGNEKYLYADVAFIKIFKEYVDRLALIIGSASKQHKTYRKNSVLAKKNLM